MLRNEPAMDPAKFAKSVRALLDEDWRRYLNFGVTWFFVKALLRRFYNKHEIPFLSGNYVDESINARLPAGLDAYEMIALAIEEYQSNATFNLGQHALEDSEGERFYMRDPDIEG